MKVPCVHVLRELTATAVVVLLQYFAIAVSNEHPYNVDYYSTDPRTVL